MQKEYYLVALNHNESVDPLKIDGVIYHEEYDLPLEFEEAKKVVSYDSVNVLAVRGLFSLRDVISGEVLVEVKKEILIHYLIIDVLKHRQMI